MTVKRLNILLFLVLAAMVTATFLIHGVPTERNFEVFPGMFYSKPADPQSDPLKGKQGNVPFTTVAGTFSKGAALYPAETVAADSALPVASLTNPFAASDQKTLTRGREVYGIFCSPCHGPTGGGDGIIAQRGFPPPPAVNSDRMRSMSDGEMYKAISQGKGNMPSYMSQIEPSDRWKSILYLRSLQPQTTDATKTIETTKSGSAAQ